MTDRKGLADFGEMLRIFGPCTYQGRTITHDDLAAALRQEPSVDEVASAIAANIDADIVGDGNIQLSGFKQAAQAIASLYRDKP